jgi:glycosyltransferase involved in cell wall biosynthesis
MFMNKNNKQKKILFFTPFAGRTGSEMFLWYMFKNLPASSNLKIALVSECDGELLKVMPPNIETFVTLKYSNKLQRILFFIQRLVGINPYEKQIIKIHKQVKPDYWYLNTILMADKVAIAKKLNVPVISHIHELMTDYSLVSYEQIKSLINYSALIIGNSQIVCEALKTLGAKHIKLQYPCIDESFIKKIDTKTKAIKDELGLARFTFVWLMSGSSSVRKGTDMVSKLAEQLYKKNMALVWLGNNSANGMDFFIEQDIKNKGLDNVFFLGKKTDDYYSYMDIMDGFVLTSREEPFGMVITEALALGKPVVAFNAGGVKEILTPHTGLICDSWNIEDLIMQMEKVANNEIGFDKQKAMDRAFEFDVTQQIVNWEQTLNDINL